MLGLEWAPVAGAVVGVVVGLTGVGGGALMAPVLLVGFGVDLPTVVATDLLFASATKLAASGVHHRNKLVDWKVVSRLWMGSLPATLLVVALAFYGLLSANPEWITRLLGLLILCSGLSLLFGSRIQLYQRGRRIRAPKEFKRFQAPLTVMAGGVLGTLVSLTSIGAGALGAIMLRALYPLRMEPKKLVATDTLHAIPVALLGGLGYLAMGQTNLELLGMLLLGSIPGTLLGSKLLVDVSMDVARKGLALALILASAKLIL